MRRVALILLMQCAGSSILLNQKSLFLYLLNSRYCVTRYVEALGQFEAASSMFLGTLKFFYGNQKNVRSLGEF